MLLCTGRDGGRAGRQRPPCILLTCAHGPGTPGKLVKLAFDPSSFLASSPFPSQPLSKTDWKLAQRKVSRTSNHVGTPPRELNNSISSKASSPSSEVNPTGSSGVSYSAYAQVWFFYHCFDLANRTLVLQNPIVNGDNECVNGVIMCWMTHWGWHTLPFEGYVKRQSPISVKERTAAFESCQGLQSQRIFCHCCAVPG